MHDVRSFFLSSTADTISFFFSPTFLPSEFERVEQAHLRKQLQKAAEAISESVRVLELPRSSFLPWADEEMSKQNTASAHNNRVCVGFSS